MRYQDFLNTKHSKVVNYGHEIPKSDIHPKLFEWQKDIVKWAVTKGRCAIFLDTGLGKTFIQLQWSKLIGVKTLIIAPLSVARQTVREAKKLDMDIQYVRSQSEITENQIWITNYEMAGQFDYSKFGAVVLDESSILKSIGGATRKLLTDLCSNIPYRLCCTATPAPNDYIELGNHTEFLGICDMNEMLSMFFINANKEHTLDFNGVVYRRKGTNKAGTEWRLKHHAEQPFFKWLASWAITMVKPSDLGYDDDGFILPPLNIKPIFIHTDYKPENQLFFTELHGIGDRAMVRSDTIQGSIHLWCISGIIPARERAGTQKWFLPELRQSLCHLFILYCLFYLLLSTLFLKSGYSDTRYILFTHISNLSIKGYRYMLSLNSGGHYSWI